MSSKSEKMQRMTLKRKTHSHCLTEEQVQMIDDALASLGNFGEVRLVVEKGLLRYVITQNSIDALKYQPGDFTKSHK